MFTRTLAILVRLSVLIVMLLTSIGIASAKEVISQEGIPFYANGIYDRDAAVSWANSNNRNDGGHYGTSEGRWCTTYVTKAWRAGGIDIPVYDSNASLTNWLRSNPSMWEVRPLDQLEKGDIIFYDDRGPITNNLYSSNSQPDLGHVVLVTGPNTASAWNAERMNVPFSWWSWYSKGVHIITQSNSGSTWIFSSDSQGWQLTSGIGAYAFADNGWVLEIAGNDPYITGPRINASANEYRYIFLRMASQTDNCGQIYFATDAEPYFDENKDVSLSIPANGSTQNLILDMSRNPRWVGTITQLRLDPACYAVGNKVVRVDKLALLSNAKAWNFKDDSHKWTLPNGIGANTFADGGWVLEISENDPYIVGPMVHIPAEEYGYIYLQMASQTDNCGEIYFATQNEPMFVQNKYVRLPIVANGGTQHLIIDMKSNPFWTGNIIQLRVDPACNAVGNKVVRVDKLALLSNAKAWNFKDDSHKWTLANGIGANSFADGGWVLEISASDPYIVGPMVNISAEQYRYIHLQMASQTDSCGEIYFATQNEPVFVQNKYVRLPIVANGGTQHLVIDMKSNPLWTGNIIQLRLDPACNAVGNRVVRIDKLEFVEVQQTHLIYLPMTQN